MPTPADPFSIRYRDAPRRIGEEMDVPVIRRYDPMRGWLADGTLTQTQMFAPDGPHTANSGYAKLADAIATDIPHRAATPRIAMDAQPHH